MIQPYTFGYGRETAGQSNIDEQLARCRSYYQQFGLPTGAKWGWFLDDAAVSTLPFIERPEGQVLFNRLRAGDIIVCVSYELIVRSPEELRDLTDRFREMGVAFHVLEPAEDVEHELRSKLTREGMAQRQQAGKRITRHPPLGWKFNRRDEVVEDYEERRVCEWIRKKHDEGMSFDAITISLRKQGIRCRDGREWARTTIGRAKLAVRDGYPAFPGRCRDVS